MNSDRAEMNDIVDHLNAWCDEDERVAGEATSGDWAAIDGGVAAVEHQDDDGYTQWPVGSTESDRDREDRVHIARHDPARVLAEVEVIRQVINDYRMSDRAILRGNPDLDDPGWRGIYAGRDAFASVLRAYAKAAGWQAEKPLPHHERNEP